MNKETEFVLTDNIVRDKLAIYGEMGLLELVKSLGLTIGEDNNTVMNHLISLMDAKQVSYDSHNGVYKSLVVLR